MDEWANSIINKTVLIRVVILFYNVNIEEKHSVSQYCGHDVIVNIMIIVRLTVYNIRGVLVVRSTIGNA